MKIGLIDVDSHNFPNLCLIIRGGTGYCLDNLLPPDVEHMYPDYSLYPKLTNNEAYGFLTRGCPNNCEFCIVSKKEGRKSLKVADLSEFWNGQKNIKLLDPNILACKEHLDLLQQLVDSKAWVDFTQGIDARLINKCNVEGLSKVKVKMIHFAFDLMKYEKKVIEGLRLYKEATNIDSRKTGVYILTNFNTTHEEDLYRVYKVIELGYKPYIMIYNKDTAPHITRRLQRWCNSRWIFESTGRNFDNYK